MTDRPQHRRWLSFDPTIHAGHIMTAATMALCTAAAWAQMRSDIAALTAENANRKTEIARIELTVEGNRQEVSRNFDKLRDDMRGWFMALDQKLDRKADKR